MAGVGHPYGDMLSTTFGQFRQADLLFAVSIEVGWIKPPGENGFQTRPFGIDDRVPCGVAIALLVDGGLPEDSFKGESQSHGSAAAGGI